nr:hypothetical protein [Tanacetum cinerariifolium]
MILESFENGPLIWPSIKENGVTRPKKYSELSSTKAIQADCDKDDDLIDAINHMMSFLTAAVTSRYPSTNNQLRNSSNRRQQATINNGRVIVQPIQGRHTSLAAGTSRTYTSGASRNSSGKQRTVVCYNYKRSHAAIQNSNFPAQPDALILSVIEQLKTQVVNYTKINLDNKSVNETLTADLERYKEQVRILKAGHNVDLKSNDIVLDLCAQSVEIDNLKQTFSKLLKEKESLKQTVTLLKNDFQKEESRNIDSVIQKTNAIVIREFEETLMLAEESRSKMLLKHRDSMMSKKKFNTKPNLVNSEEPNHSTRPTQVEVPKEFPKVSMVHTSLKKLKHHLASFDVAVEQHHVESKRFQVKMNKVLNENERLLEQVISKDIVNMVVNSTKNNAYEPVYECERCVKLETELQKDFIKREIYDKLFK